MDIDCYKQQRKSDTFELFMEINVPGSKVKCNRSE